MYVHVHHFSPVPTHMINICAVNTDAEPTNYNASAAYCGRTHNYLENVNSIGRENQ